MGTAMRRHGDAVKGVSQRGSIDILRVSHSARLRVNL
jgi:hypothetical protein